MGRRKFREDIRYQLSDMPQCKGGKSQWLRSFTRTKRGFRMTAKWLKNGGQWAVSGQEDLVMTGVVPLWAVGRWGRTAKTAGSSTRKTAPPV